MHIMDHETYDKNFSLKVYPQQPPIHLHKNCIDLVNTATNTLPLLLFPYFIINRSVVTALVRNNVSTIVDIEKILQQLNGTQPLKEQPKQVGCTSFTELCLACIDTSCIGVC